MKISYKIDNNHHVAAPAEAPLDKAAPRYSCQI